MAQIDSNPEKSNRIKLTQINSNPKKNLMCLLVQAGVVGGFEQKPKVLALRGSDVRGDTGARFCGVCVRAQRFRTACVGL